MKTLGDLLRKALNVALLHSFCIIIVETREDMLLVQPLQLLAAPRYVSQQVGDFVGNVGPAGGGEGPSRLRRRHRPRKLPQRGGREYLRRPMPKHNCR